MPDHIPNSADEPPISHPIRLSELNARKRHAFDLEPDATARRAIADVLAIPAVRKLRFAGALIPEGKTDWHLDATLGASVVQTCVVTLEPVSTRIEEPVQRRYLASLNDPDLLTELDGEYEMPEDDSQEPLPATLDLGVVMTEALALALPPWPRAAGAEAGEVVLTEPGKAAMRDEDARPFANLRDQLAAKGKDGGEVD